MVLLAGKNVNGAQRWLQLGPLGGQPSEFMKVLMITRWPSTCTMIPSSRVAASST